METTIYEATSYILRYWFLVLIVLILLGVIVISLKEYGERKYVMGMAGKYIGYIEVLAGEEECVHCRYGLLPNNTIGRSRRADVSIPDRSLKRAHALLYVKNGQAYINSLGAGHILKNGKKVIRPNKLKSGDVLTLGDVIACVHLKEENG